MKKFIPNMYLKNIHDINYSKLKEKGIKCLIFDLDNTIALIDQKKCDEKTKKLFTKLKQDFTILIISNNKKERIKPYQEMLGVDAVYFAMKPFLKGFRRVLKKYPYRQDELCIIGDQLMTDILGGNRFHIFTILVDPLGEKDLKVTIVNRFLEQKIINHLSKKGVLMRGRYYE